MCATRCILLGAAQGKRRGDGSLRERSKGHGRAPRRGGQRVDQRMETLPCLALPIGGAMDEMKE